MPAAASGILDRGECGVLVVAHMAQRAGPRDVANGVVDVFQGGRTVIPPAPERKEGNIARLWMRPRSK